MTREEAIKQLKYCKSVHNGSFGLALRIAIKSLEQTRWIPVSERLPKKSGVYLCTFGGNNLTRVDNYTTELDAKKIFDEPEEYAGWQSQNVIAWMPLPEPYKAEREDKE